MENDEAPDACIRCHSKVFEMDKIVTKTGLMHKHCLSCNECKSNLDASSFYNGFDGEVYCKYCYAVNFGHKQKSSYKGWMDVKAIMGEKGERDTCPRCTGKVLIIVVDTELTFQRFFFYLCRFLRLKELSLVLEITIRIVSVVLSVTRNWIRRLAAKVFS